MHNKLPSDQTNKQAQNIPFKSLDLDPQLLKGLNQAGFTHCTPIQAKTLPIALKNLDVAGQAQTGTGKTIAFLLATMNKLLQSKSHNYPKALVLAPTRELALQIQQDAQLIGKFTKLKMGCLIGGSNYDKQKKMLSNGVDILIATPGRLIDMFKQRLLKFYNLEVVIIDEADRMFDLGFIKDIRFILNRTPKPAKRLGLLFSATLSYKVMELAYSHMNNPTKIMIEPKKVLASKLQESLYFPANDEKIPLLLNLLRQQKPKKCIVFVNTKVVGEKLWKVLQNNSFKAYLLSGNVAQNQRIRILAGFKKNSNSILVATDVAARGLHIDNVTHVFNYDLPQDAEDYVHRIGRTARAGLSGIAISFACENYSFSIPDIEQFIGHQIPVKSINDIKTKPVKKHNKAKKPQAQSLGKKHSPIKPKEIIEKLPGTRKPWWKRIFKNK